MLEDIGKTYTALSASLFPGPLAENDPPLPTAHQTSHLEFGFAHSALLCFQWVFFLLNNSLICTCCFWFITLLFFVFFLKPKHSFVLSRPLWLWIWLLFIFFMIRGLLAWLEWSWRWGGMRVQVMKNSCSSLNDLVKLSYWYNFGKW